MRRASRFLRLLPLLAGPLVAAAAGFAWWHQSTPTPPRTRGPLPAEAYLWQRVHSPAVAAALAAHAGEFSRVVVLAAEVSWPARASAPGIVRVPLDTEALRAAPALGLALRLGRWHGDFARDEPTRELLTSLARERVATAQAAGLSVAELQLDFDAAESQLAGYRHWVEAVRAAVAPVRVTFTALPAWLDRPGDFEALARAADGYVLQVHALVRPTSPTRLAPLCDATAAARAVERAAALGHAFRVALPTYAYEVAFDDAGHFAGLVAEGPEPAWPATWTRRTIGADAAALAALVARWCENRPAALAGVIWYRLPVDGDARNWPWPTLAAVMDGRPPVARLSLATSPRDDGLVDLVLRNDGDAPFTGPLHVHARWTGAQLLAADALPPLDLRDDDPGSAALTARTLTLAPGATRTVAWWRFDGAPTSFDVSLQTH